MRYKSIAIVIIIQLVFSISLLAELSDIVISEICANNENGITNELGDRTDWIELYNSGTQAVNLNGLYLSDKKDFVLKHQITSANLVLEPDSFILFFADGNIDLGTNHLSFKIGEGETVVISSLSLGIIDSTTIAIAEPDHSYGRVSYTHDSNWYYFTTPTPEMQNSTQGYIGYASSPTFSLLGGYYSGSASITISADENQEIYYTTDNHDPHPDSTFTQVYNGNAVELAETKVLRARCYKQDYLPSSIISHIYIINQTYSLPVWSTITDPNNLYGTKGIYSHPYGETIKWERFSQHWFLDDDQLKFGLNSGIRIQGGNSVGMPKKSFRLHFRDDYGYSRLEYPLFTHSDQNSFKHIVMRSGYDDDLSVGGTLLRDPLSTEFWRITGNLASASEWAVLMLNDRYWGIYNLRESVDEEFIEDHLGTTDFDMIRYQKKGPEVKHGSSVDWDYLTSFINTADFSTEEAYNEACSLIDMDSFLNLLAFVHCSQYRSWTWGASAYKVHGVNTKWRWIIWDTDRAYSTLTWNGFTEYANTYNEKWPNFMPQKLILNNTFKERLINRTADFLNAWFEPTTSVSLLDSLQAIIAPEISNDKQRWNSSTNWEGNVNSMRNFLNNRPNYVRNQINSYFSIDNTYDITIDVEGKGTVVLNYLNLESFPWSGTYFEGIPISLTAIPAPGYKFEEWSNGTTSYTIDDLTLDADFAITAYFIEDLEAIVDVRINEIMYNDNPNWDSGDWFEIYNSGDDVNISGWWVRDENPLNKYTIPQNTILKKQDYLVLAENLTAFNEVNNAESIKAKGSFGDGLSGFSLSNSGECIYIYKSDGTVMDSVCYYDSGLWPGVADGYGPSLQLKSTESDNDIPANWFASQEVLFTPGTENRLLGLPVNYMKTERLFVYPNPAKEVINISLPATISGSSFVSIFNHMGVVVFQANINASESKRVQQINIQNLPKGMYLIKLNAGQVDYTTKLIVQ